MLKRAIIAVLFIASFAAAVSAAEPVVVCTHAVNTAMINM
jgi:hypothetical protein